ncbi:MAG TPA: hypothetical protein VM346_10810 [Sphingomicrobium sp.]|nr:hypothetical protein [Sphingomicrobium sp.]
MRRASMHGSIFAALGLLAFTSSAQGQSIANDFIFVWANDADQKSSNFLAIVDVSPSSPTFGDVVGSLATGSPGKHAHHTEHEMPAGGILAANDFDTGETFLFDLRTPQRPKIAGSFVSAGEYTHAHSFARLPSGNILATYQTRGHGNAQPGGLVELSPSGEVLRTSSAADPSSNDFIRPYSLTVVPVLDRVVTTSADMHETQDSRSVQIWRLSDLSLIRTIELPAGPRGTENRNPAEPRLLADGETVIISTFSCGLFRVTNLAGDDPSAEWIHSFPGAGGELECALPVVAGKYWIQTDPTIPGLIALDMSDPGRPTEAGRMALPAGAIPHWISLAPDGCRIVLTGYKDLTHQVLLANLDPATGALTLDNRFRMAGSSQPGISFNRPGWPHGDTGAAIPHGAVFHRPQAH